MPSSLGRCLPALLLFLLSPRCRGQDSVELVPGDVMLGAIFSVNNIEEKRCGDYDVDTLKEMTAVQWFLETLNSMSYIPGVRLGLKVYRSCQSGENATRGAVQMLEQFHVLDDDAQDINTTKPLLGILGPGRTQEAIMVSRFLSSLPSSQRPLLISGSATGAALADRALYSNFFRVIPPDSTQVQVLVKLLQKLGWNYVSIVFDDDAYGREAAEQLRALSHNLGLCVPSFAALTLDYRSERFITATATIIDQLRGVDSSLITGVVFIGSAATAKEFLGQLAKRVNFVRFIFSEALGLQTSALSGSPLSKGALVAAPPNPPLPEFRTFWNSIWTNSTMFSTEAQRNPWLAGYYTTFCSVSYLLCWRQSQSNFPLIQDNTQWFFEYYQVKATAVFAAILKHFHQKACGADFDGVCFNLKNLIRNKRGEIQNHVENSSIGLHELSSLSSVFSAETIVKFDEQGEIALGGYNDSVYNVFNYRECDNGGFCFQKVGTYDTLGNLYLDTQTLRGYTHSGDALLWPHFPKSQCKNDYDCSDCLPPNLADDFIFVPGDVYFVAVAPVHDKVSSNPLQCGDIRTSAGADFVQSVLFAVQQVNQKRGQFRDIFGSDSLGVVILNSCSRELVIKEKLIALYKGTLILPDGRNSSHIVPKIAGYVGAFFSAMSVAMYEVLSSLDIRFVMLSPANTSPELSDRIKYPQYLRLTSGEDSQVRALLTLVRELGHQYVQVIYDPDDIYTLTIKESINKLSTLKAFSICVVNNIAADDEEKRFYSVLDDLRKNSWAPLVIVALQAEHTQRVMRDILPQTTSSDLFRFLGLDAWARSEDILKVPRGSRLLGSLAMSVELPLNQLFKEYLRNIDPLTTINPWLKYFWEERKQCYFDGSFLREGKTELCPSDLTSDYVQNIWVPFYIDAVYVFAIGLNSAMLQQCGQAALCDSLTSQHLVDSIRDVRLDLFKSGVQVKVFDDNGDGVIVYKIFQVSYDTSTADSEDVTFVEVGLYDHESLTLDKNSLWILKNLEVSRCPNSDACGACFSSSSASSRNDTKDDSLSGALMGTIVVIVVLIIIVAVVVVLLVLACRRLREPKAGGGEISVQNLSGSSRSGDPRPLPPIRESGAFRESSSGSGSGSLETALNVYDYLHSDGAIPSHVRASHAYLPHGPMEASTGTGNMSSTHLPSSISLNSTGYVTRDSDPRFNHNPSISHAPYDRVVASGLARETEGGRQNSRLEVSGESDGSVFENETGSGDEPRPPPPDPCMSQSGSDYLTPTADYLTPIHSLSPP